MEEEQLKRRTIQRTDRAAWNKERRRRLKSRVDEKKNEHEEKRSGSVARIKAKEKEIDLTNEQEGKSLVTVAFEAGDSQLLQAALFREFVSADA